MSKIIEHKLNISMQRLVKSNSSDTFLDQENLNTITEVLEKTLVTILNRLQIDNIIIEINDENN